MGFDNICKKEGIVILGTQLHTARRDLPLEECFFPPIKNDLMVKARGGLWTSSYDKEFGSAWVQWCLHSEFNLPKDSQWDCYLLEPKEDTKILICNSLEDLIGIHKEYKRTDSPNGLGRMLERYLDYEKIAKDYDAFHLTTRGQLETHLPLIYSPKVDINLYGWDCESTHWFRWGFKSVVHLGKVKFREG